MPDATPTDQATARARLAQMARLCAAVRAMAEALEAAEPMPGGGHLQATMDTAWNALIALHLGLEDWIARHDDDEALYPPGA